jgi:ferrous iron transport protein B
VLGVPILFGVLRKELSLLMIYQALGTFDVGSLLDWVQIMTFPSFLTFYMPCISTFAVMLKTIEEQEIQRSFPLRVEREPGCAERVPEAAGGWCAVLLVTRTLVAGVGGG